MGNVSSCCSAEPAASDKQVISGTNGTKKVSPAAVPTTETDLEKFRRKLEDTVDIVVVLADGSRLECRLKYVPSDRSLVISCEVNGQTNMRVIPLEELTTLLHGREQLRRVETRANLMDDPTCVAMHMMTGNCIPICFEKVADKENFVELIKFLKD